MNVIFGFGMVISIIFMLFGGKFDFMMSIINASQSAVDLTVKMAVMLVFWLGVLEIMEKLGLTNKLAKLLSPLLNALFPNESNKTKQYIVMNFSSNILGVGNSATPMSIKAIQSMKTSHVASYSMVMFFVINATSLQLLPMTIISLRQINGSTDPSCIVIPSIISSVIATALGIALVSAFVKKDSVCQTT